MQLLLTHQKAGIAFVVTQWDQQEGAYLTWPPGGMKTRTTIEAVRLQAKRLNRPLKVLVLCPKVAKGVWAQELERWVSASRQVDVPVIFGDSALQRRADGTLWLITNYDQIINKTKEKVLAKWGADVLVLDEAHYCASISSARSRAVARLAKKIHYHLLLSGTPSDNPWGWYPQYRLIASPTDPVWSQQTYTAYKNRITLFAGPMMPWRDKNRGANGYDPEYLEVAKQAAARYSHVIDKSVLNLPEPVTTVVPITLSPSEMKAYEQMEHDLFVEFKDTDTVADAPSVLTKILRLQQITGGFVADTEHGIHRFGTSKLDACMELVEERVGAGQKVVIVARYREDCAALQKAMKVKYGTINGDTSDKDRADIMASFQTGSLMVVILQPRAGGVAISLSAASAMIIYSAEVSSIVMEQVIGRCWRPGQTGHLQILPLLVPHSVDSDLWGALQNKMEYTSLVKLLLAHLKG